MTGYYGWTTNGTVVCAELGGDGALLDPRPLITGWDISGGKINTTTIPGLKYCILEYDELGSVPVVTNAEVQALGESLELAVPDPPAGTRIRFYCTQASD